MWPPKAGETKEDAKFREETTLAYLSLNEGEIVAERGQEAWLRGMQDPGSFEPSTSWRVANELEQRLLGLSVEGGDTLDDAEGEIIAMRRPDAVGGGYVVWIDGSDLATGTIAETAKEAARLLIGGQNAG